MFYRNSFYRKNPNSLKQVMAAISPEASICQSPFTFAFLLQQSTLEAHLEHGVGEEGLQRPLLTVRFGLVLLQQLVKVSVLFAMSQDLQAVLVVPNKLLVDIQHGQQDVKQVR